MKNWLFLSLILASCSFANAGPFGLEMGMSIERIRQLGVFESIPGSRHIYSSEKMVGGHPDAYLYTVIVSPVHGLCKVGVNMKEFQTSAYGEDIQSNYASFKSSLMEKYGKPSGDFDFLKQGAVWKQPQNWTRALQTGERVLGATWSAKKAKLPDSLSTILLEAAAESRTRGAIRIGYEFENWDVCQKEMMSEKNKGL
jgi:hypothetical protein